MPKVTPKQAQANRFLGELYKCKRSRVSGTCNNYAAHTEVIEEALPEHFRDVWLSPPGQKALRKAIDKIGR